jgi:hypothetical protein
MGQYFGMTPEQVKLDVTEADEFALVCPGVRRRGERPEQASEKGVVRWRGI